MAAELRTAPRLRVATSVALLVRKVAGRTPPPPRAPHLHPGLIALRPACGTDSGPRGLLGKGLTGLPFWPVFPGPPSLPGGPGGPWGREKQSVGPDGIQSLDKIHG